MRTRISALLLSFATLSASTMVYGQDPLDELYGQAVHSYFRGNLHHAEELLNEVINAGSQDPRAYYFRGLCQSTAGAIGGMASFEQAAQMEMEGKKVVNVGKALERIQGPVRVEIEKIRTRARLASRARLLEMQRSKYEEMQRSGNPLGGIVVPPRPGLDPAPTPNGLAPNDPFNSGMTKGEPKPLEDGKPTPAAEPDKEPMPADPIPTPPPTEPEDPFKVGS